MRILLFSIILILHSCRIGGLTNDYKTLNENQRQSILPYSEEQTRESGKIYKLNAIQLLGELKKHPKSLVYLFANGCTSDLCKPMAVYQDYAKAHNLKLFLVMVGFGNLKKTTEQPLTSSLFALDAEHYGAKYRFKYQKYFQNEIQGLPLKSKEEKYQGNLYFFNGNVFDRIERELPETKQEKLQL